MNDLCLLTEAIYKVGTDSIIAGIGGLLSNQHLNFTSKTAIHQLYLKHKIACNLLHAAYR